MFVAMNNFQIAPGREADFERQWHTRESYLQGVLGFMSFKLLRCDTPGEYISESLWRDRADFMGWMNSDAFTKAHRQAGSVQGVVQGPPHAKTYDVVVSEENSAAAT